MAKNTYIGVNNVSRKVKKMYIGVNGVARKVKKGYIGVNGVARQFYSSRLGYTAFYGTGSNILSQGGGTIGDYAILYDQDTYSTGFTAVSNSLTTTTVATTSGYRMYSSRAIMHNNQLMNSVFDSSAQVPYLRGINTSLTQQIYTSLSLPYRQRDDNYSYYEEFNNSIYYLYRYEDDDGYGRSLDKKISSSMTISDLNLPAAKNSTFPSGAYPRAGGVCGSATTPSYLHFMLKGVHYPIYSLNSSETSFLNTYYYVNSSGDAYGFSSTYLKASFDGKAVFGWGSMATTASSYATLNTSGVSIDNSLTYMFYPTILNVAKPQYSFNVVFDNVLWVGTAFHTYDYPKVICKLKSGLTQELDSTYLTTYQNATGERSNSQITAALPTSVNDPSFLVCAMVGPGGNRPAMIYQR